MRRTRSTALLMAALAAATAGLAACGSSGGSSGGSSASGSKVLKIWWYESPGSAYQIAWDQAVTDFKRQHPGVTVQFSLKSFNQMQQNASMILNSSDVPDVMEYNKGDATTGLLSKQGLLTDLTAQATKYGWDKKLSPDLQVTARYSPKGVMGSGDWYGVSDYAEYLTVYYNKTMFAKYHIAVPTTFAQFTAAMADFVKDGVTPLANAGNDYMAMQYLYELELGKATPQDVQNYQRYTGPVNFHDAAWTGAAATFQSWVKQGYIAKDSVGLTATQAGNDFQTGKNPMMVSGSWWAGTFQSAIKNFQWGSFLWPGNTLNAGSGGNLFVVPKNAADKQLAYEFINDTLQPDVEAKLADNGAVPISASTSGVTNPQGMQLIQNFQTLANSNGLAYYPDWPTPSFYNTLLAQTQDLMNGASADQVLGTLQSTYDQYVNSLG
ncbi:MAG TPA: extracellular solute-binding protein [Streptosporangiaceae bacterium]|nr:extracellular solute-binding protein [Streptosporangiaceae bacterium]